MKRLLAPVLALGLALVAAVVLIAPSTGANAQTGGTTYTAQLAPLNGTNSTGTATIVVNGNSLTVTINSTGLSPSLAHAQHIHIGGQNICPTNAAVKNSAGHLTTTAGQPFYGDIMVSLTTTGDVSAKSGLAVDRMPTAAADGSITYTRTFDLPSGVTPAMIAQGVVVQHGIDYNKSGTYDGTAKSDLDPSLPEEATDPANCGKLIASGAGAGTTPAAGGAASTPAAGSTPAASSTSAGSAMAGMSTPATGVTVPNTGTGPGNGSGMDMGWILLVSLGAVVLGSMTIVGALRARRP